MIIILFFIIKVLPQNITQTTPKHNYIKYVNKLQTKTRKHNKSISHQVTNSVTTKE